MNNEIKIGNYILDTLQIHFPWDDLSPLFFKVVIPYNISGEEMGERDIREHVTNNLLLLYLIDKANERGKMEDELKLQKMVFLAEKKLIERKLKGFSYNFFRWHKGPFSKEVSMDLSLLFDNNLVSSQRGKIELTRDGKEVLRGCFELLKKNQTFLSWIDPIVEKHATLDPETVKDEVYAMKIMVPKIRKLMSIREVPKGQIILFKSSDEKVKRIFEVDEAWMGTLELILDVEALRFLVSKKAK